LIKNIVSSDLFKGIATLSIGTLIAQVIPVLVQIFLRRVFDAEIFGVYAVFLSIVSIIVVFASLRFELAIVLPQKDKDASSILVLSILISLTINIIIALIFLFFNKSLCALFNIPNSYSKWIYLIPISAFLLGAYQSLNYYLIRKQAFKSSALNKIWRRLIEGIIHVLFGVLKIPIGLVIGDIAGSMANNISGLIQSLKNKISFKELTLKNIKYNAKRYNSFPKYQALPALLNTFSLLAPILFISNIYSSADTGYFDLSRNVLILPVTLMATAISQVLMQRLSTLIQQKYSIKKLIYNIIKATTIIYIPLIVIMLIAGETLFSFVFGSNWALSGYYSKILVFSFAFQFIISPISIVLTVLEKLKTIALWQTFYFIAILSLLFFKELSLEHFLMIYTVINFVLYTFYFILINNEIKKYEFFIRQNNY